EEITAVQVEAALQFPELFLYEEGLFYVEHGCQYDPANAFSNFANPRLQDNPKYIELPAGSLFVRYFFNDVEKVHPFADNMKPISKYVFWLIRKSPTSLYKFLRDLLPMYLKATRKVHQKTRRHPDENQQQSKNAFEAKLFQIQKAVRDGMKAGSKQTTRRMVGSVALVLLSVVLALVGVRLLALGSYLWMSAAFVGTLAFLLWSSYLFQSLDNLLAEPFLYKAASQVCAYLNQGKDEAFTAVPYLIFGHDHAADVRPIHTDNQPGFAQWYVNTGAWVPVFSEENRLLRDDEQLTFLRLVPRRLQNNDRAA
ncbi:MAG: hypothetical protein KC421_00145, partial [Anaerolineales bacterium]|nr:hypothetical protein [Anaerolineales bacterium]